LNLGELSLNVAEQQTFAAYPATRFMTKPPFNLEIPEIREYLCRGVVDDEETGLPSPIVEFVVAK
jgi:hypothetical protein